MNFSCVIQILNISLFPAKCQQITDQFDLFYIYIYLFISDLYLKKEKSQGSI